MLLIVFLFALGKHYVGSEEIPKCEIQLGHTLICTAKANVTDINFLPDVKLDNLGAIEIIQIEYNNLTKLGRDDLNFTNLAQLSLKGNQIWSIENNTFINCRKLGGIDLSENEIIEIPKDFFENLNLKWIDLSKNNITTIPWKLLKNLKHLFYINLSGNRISYVDLSVFKKGMYKIDLSSNEICNIFIPKEFDVLLAILNNNYIQCSTCKGKKSDIHLNPLICDEYNANQKEECSCSTNSTQNLNSTSPKSIEILDRDNLTQNLNSTPPKSIEILDRDKQ